MFLVYFTMPSDPDARVIVNRCKTDVEAVQFALALHQATNVSHSISVRDEDGNGGDSEMICHFFVPEVPNG